MAKFVNLTRIYKAKGAKVATNGKFPTKTQPFTVSVEAIASVRPNNRLGHPEHRATISMVCGGSVDVSDKYTAVLAAIGAPAYAKKTKKSAR